MRTGLTAKERVLYRLMTGLGTGHAPVAPGTAGTLPAVLLGVALQWVWQGPALAWILLLLALLLLAVGCTTTDLVAKTCEHKDPSEFVLDEIVGYLLALSMVAFTMAEGPTPLAHAACFLLFRTFDILKPPPARHLERIPGAVGIMLDDVAAGIYAGTCLIAMNHFQLF